MVMFFREGICRVRGISGINVFKGVGKGYGSCLIFFLEGFIV